MVWFRDLDPIGEPSVLAVGWLETGRDYARGAVEPDCVSALAELLIEPWHSTLTLGLQRCGFCRVSGGPSSVKVDRKAIRVGKGVLFVPDRDRVYVAPTMIIHYIDAHEYSPPAAFREAVVQCPKMRSTAYIKAIKPFVKRLKALA